MDAADGHSTNVRNDLEAIVETHRLLRSERKRLALIITGAVPGNRDKPLHSLAETIRHHVVAHPEVTGIFDLLEIAAQHTAPRPIPQLLLALLDFLATMDNYRHFSEVERAVAALAAQSDDTGLAAARSIFASCLHRYRVDHLPFENRRQAFTTIRKYFHSLRPGTGMPEDGDALGFWCATSREGFTTYAATLSALADFTTAAAMRGATASVSFEALAEQGFDTDADLFATLESEGIGLAEAIDALEEAGLKVFKGPEIDELRRLVTILPVLRRWRRSALAALCFGPVQNVLVQLKRQGAPEKRLVEAAGCGTAPGYSKKLTELADLRRTCIDVLVLHRSHGAQSDETASALSKTMAETSKGIARLMRRKSFSELDPARLREEIEGVAPALAVAATALREAVDRIEAWPQMQRDAAFDADRQRFAETFRHLYCSLEE